MSSRPSRGSSLLGSLVDFRPGEGAPMVFAALYFFFILSSYFILRPIRDEMAVASGSGAVPYLFLGTLAAMLVANPIYGAMVSRYTRRRFVLYAYAFFAFNLLLFYMAWRLRWNEQLTGRAFFIWTSVFNLFVPSVFWGLMADTFHSSQAKRLFGFIAVGGTLGAISGSAITAFLVETVGVPNLLLVSSAFVIVAVCLVMFFPKVPPVADGTSQPVVDRDEEVVGGTWYAGVAHVLRSPYLAGIAAFIMLYTLGSTVLYVAQTDIIGQYYTDRDQRRAVLGQMEFWTQTITAIGQAFLTSRIIKVAGLPVTLSAVPFVSIIGFGALALASGGALPLLATFIAFSITRRATEFILTNPSRKILFTVLSREDKYKASSFIETFIYRSGDLLWSAGYNGLIALGLLLAGISWISAGTALLFLALGVWLGKRQQELARETGR